MTDNFIASLLDAACDIDNDLAARFEDHIRSMTGIESELPLDFLPDRICLT